MITLLAGDSGSPGNRDCDFIHSKFSFPWSIILIGQNKLLVVDSENHTLRIMDMDTRTVTSLCSGVRGSSDGDMKTYELDAPYSLMVLNDTLYVGQKQKIRKIQGMVICVTVSIK